MDKVQLIFNLYKDKVIISKPFRLELSRKYKLTDEEIRNLYIKIQNYQIKKYGEIMTYDKDVYTAEELKIISRNAKQRRHDRKKRSYEERLALDKIFGNVLGQVDNLCKQAKELK